VNVFVDNQISAKLADFGLAFVIESTTGGLTTASGPKGTVAWMSPERTTSEGPTPKMSPPMDVYSFGILCHTVSPKNLL
jgi:serine/threonine protein kinase